MEVFIRGVSDRTTEKSLNDTLRPVLERLGISDWVCQKPNKKYFAKLTFLKIEDSKKFLNLHGQTKHAVTGRRQLSPGCTNILHNGVPIYCSLSSEPADPFALRSLDSEKKAREQQKIERRLDKYKENEYPRSSRSLECLSISCGVWAYLGSELVFMPYLAWADCTTMTFNSKSLIIKTVASQRIDITYPSINSVAGEGLPNSSITFTLAETPRFFQCEEEDVAAISDMQLLRSMTKKMNIRTAGPIRTRITGLNSAHEKIAGTCLVYRIMLSKSTNFELQKNALAHAHDVPQILRRHINNQPPEQGFPIEFGRLLRALSPKATKLPFAIKFQLQRLAQNFYLTPMKVMALIPEMERMASRCQTWTCVRALRRLFQDIPYSGPTAESADFELFNLINIMRKHEETLKMDGLYLEEPMPKNTALIHKAMVTPTGIYLSGPEAETNNRILRQYSNHHECFLHVQFSDEDGSPLQYNPAASNEKIYHERFKNVLNSGISIAGQHYDFLGFSHSSLRAQCCWFMSPFIHNDTLLFDREVIKALGDFSHIRSPAKCAARIGQAFSDTREAIKIPIGVVKEMDDIERDGRVFSDGVGTISKESLEDIWDGLLAGKEKKPTVLQIRYKGAKGMIALDSRLMGKQIFLRPSMIKYRGSTSTDLEICTAGYKPLPLYLNQQLIKILEDMGVDEQWFLDLQADEVERLRRATSNAVNASHFLRAQGIGEKINLPWFIKMLARLNLAFYDDEFFINLVEMAVLIELRTLKHKARIPVKKGYTLLGIMDETGILEEGEIFCIVDAGDQGKVITGLNGRRVIITRSPALHPGDIQLAKAVDVPRDSPLRKLRNCICFSQKGSRDLPSKLSGGDLDGDLYQIIFDATPQCQMIGPPAEYARLPALDLERPVERQDMTDFFITFMATDQLGRISNAHKIVADQSELGVNDLRCILLAEMASTAVDFSKTGIAVDMTQMPKYSSYRPDFMAPGPHVEVIKGLPSFDVPDTPKPQSEEDEDFTPFKYYESQKVLGTLYRAIDEQRIFQKIQRYSNENKMVHAPTSISPVLRGIWEHIQRNCKGVQYTPYVEKARGIRDEYEDYLLTIMSEYSTSPHHSLSELEVFSNNILGKTGAQSKRQRELSISMRERWDEDLWSVIKRMTGKQKQEFWDEDDDSDSETVAESTKTEWNEEALGISMACLWVGMHEKGTLGRHGDEIQSFARVAAAVALKEVERAH